MGKELKRMNYFDGLFLDAEDYKLEQSYQMRQMQLHNRHMHSWGIVYGLYVKPDCDLDFNYKSASGEQKDEYRMKIKKAIQENRACNVRITEGLALNAVKEMRDSQNEEEISQLIYIIDNHPDNPVSLEKCDTSRDVYIYLEYSDEKTDRDLLKGKGEPIHIWDRSRICYTNITPSKFTDSKIIILARIKIETIPADEPDKTIAGKPYIDSSCISYNETNDVNSKLIRKYSGPAGSNLSLGKIIFKSGEDVAGMPSMRVKKDGEGFGLEIDSGTTYFTGNIDVKGDLIVNGIIETDNDDTNDEMLITNRYIQVNSRANDPELAKTWEIADGGLQLYRGESEDFPDATLRWSERNSCWEAGYKYKIGKEDKETVFYKLIYGKIWDRLVNKGNVDDLHKHSELSSDKGVALKIDETGNLSVKTDINLNEKTIWLRENGNTSHGLGWYGKSKTFSNTEIDGPVLFGYKGGVLGTTDGKTQKSTLSWNNYGNVGIGIQNPIDDKLEVAGTLRVLSAKNPIRLTAAYTDFSKYGSDKNNCAEISNDTGNYKALMIIGNNSAIKSQRKVAIWDRLDVNGFLYVNGDLQVSDAFYPSIGSGANKGIVFPSDPGGGAGDSAWIRYYPRSNEDCTFEIGTSNDGDDNISLMASGNVGIGTLTPGDPLDVTGWTRMLSGTNPLRFTSVWSGFPEAMNRNAEISNDTSAFKSLMIAGNRSAGGARKVSIWDDLYVNGTLRVNGNFETGYAIVPSVGYEENKGISFPKDPYGGSGDAAWIKYYSDPRRGGGENMTLEIGISNDSEKTYNNSGDRIRLSASGGVYVDGYFLVSSSRELKENIEVLSTQKAKTILEGLNPVTYNYRGDTVKNTIGFIAEDVPKEVAANDQKAISPFEIVAVLTSVVKEQKKTITMLQKQVESISNRKR